jgi:DAK2 domain fusion protein YloV
MEAKGNSGVILSTIVRGLARVLGEAERVDGAVMAEALRAGATSAYQAVKVPVEGTMLTVIREMAEEAQLREVRALPVVEGLTRIVARGDDAVERTPEMLDKLREAGVVDAGGAGLVELVRGVLHGLTGEELPDATGVAEELTEEAIHLDESEFRYCTVFVVEGQALDLEALHSQLEPLGDSLLVTGDETVAKIHVHTDEPDGALAIGRAVGVVDQERVEIGDMRSQAAERERWLAQLHAAAQALPSDVALVAVAQGTGNREILRSEGASIVIEGGQTMNPSVGQILEAVTAVNTDHVIVLPNNPNVRLAAENAAAESTKDVRVIATASVPEGIVAAFEFDASRNVDVNEAAMRDAAGAIETGEITRASRDATVDGVTPPRAISWRSSTDVQSRPGGTSGTRSTRCSSGSPPTAARMSTCSAGRARPATTSSALVQRRTASRPWSRRGGSRTTRSSSGRSRTWRPASCSSRTTRCTALRWSSCSGCRRGSRWSAPSARGTRPRRRRASSPPTSS